MRPDTNIEDRCLPHYAMRGGQLSSRSGKEDARAGRTSEVTHDDRWLINQGANRILEALSEAQTSKL